MKKLFFILLIPIFFLIPTKSFAYTDISPILTSPVATTTVDNHFLIRSGDQRSVMDSDCTSTTFIDAGPFSTETFDLNYELTSVFIPQSIPSGVYTLGLGTYVNCGSALKLDPLDIVGIFYWNGSTLYDGSNEYSFPTDRTAIWSVTPYDYEVVTSPVSFSTIGWVENWKEKMQVHYIYYRNEDLRGIVPLPNLYIKNTSVDIENIFSTEPPNFSFNLGTTSLPLTKDGDYTLRTSITEPMFSLFGFDLFSRDIVSTTTTFTIGTPTAHDQKQRDIQLALAEEGLSNASSTPTDCNLFKISDCMNLLFIPSADSLSFVNLSQQKELIFRKPPFGYFSAVKDILNQFSTTTTASTTPVGIGTIATIFAPLLAGLILLLWFILALWIFNRLRLWNFQS